MVENFEVDNLSDAIDLFDYKAFTNKLYGFIENQITSSINEWMILYPLSQFTTDSFYSKHLNLTFLSSGDYEYWQKINSDFKSSNGFNISNGKYYRRDMIPEAYEVPQTWLVLKTVGTKETTIEKTEVIIRKLVICLYTFLTSSYEDLHNIGENTTPRFCIIFPKDDERIDFSFQIQPLPFLQPPLSSKIKIDFEVLKNVNTFVRIINELEIKFQRRFEIATLFIHNAILSYSDIERFIYFYIGLDALFGEKGKVKKSRKWFAYNQRVGSRYKNKGKQII